MNPEVFDMVLYFENSRGVKRVIAEPQTREEAWKEIDKFCSDRNFKIYYSRQWRNNEGLEVYDVGSHSEFFYLDDRE